jgi:hypothetical protein
MSAPDMLPYWSADIKVDGLPATVTCDDGEWTGDALPPHFLDELQRRITTLADASGVNINVVGGYKGMIFAEALRSMAPVYGIDTNFDQGDDDPNIVV